VLVIPCIHGEFQARKRELNGVLLVCTPGASDDIYAAMSHLAMY
jgi:hypothetical protein